MLVKRKKNDPDNICEGFPTLLVLGGSLVLGIATHIAICLGVTELDLNSKSMSSWLC